MSTQVILRTAGAPDVAAMNRLIAENLEAGHLLPRTVADLDQHAPRFVVADCGGEVVGCAELAPLGDGVAEVRSLVVDQAFRGMRIGAALVRRLADRAAARGFSTLCAFTHDPSHFVRMGFSIVPHVWVPEKIARDCVSCALFRRCGQYAVTLALGAAALARPEHVPAIGSAVPARLSVRALHARARERERKEAVPA